MAFNTTRTIDKPPKPGNLLTLTSDRQSDSSMPPGLELLEDGAPAISIQMPRHLFLLDYERRRFESEPRVRSLTRVGSRSSSFEARLHQGSEFAVMELGNHTFSWGDLTRWSELQPIGAIQQTQLNQLYYEFPVLNSLGSLNRCADSGDLKRKANDAEDCARPTKKVKSEDDGCTAGSHSQTVSQGAPTPNQLQPLMLWPRQQSTSTQGFQRTGTKVFMALAPLLAARKDPVHRRCCHDLESIIWCLAWYVTQGETGASWQEGSYNDVGLVKGGWIDNIRPKVLPACYRAGTEQLWTPLAITAYNWKGRQIQVFTHETLQYSEKANMELIDSQLPCPKRPIGEEWDWMALKVKEGDIREEDRAPSGRVPTLEYT